jgi:hypothetical protein
MAESQTSTFPKMGEEPLTSHLVNASANRGNTIPVARKGPSSDSEPGDQAVRGVGRMASGEINGPCFSPVTRISFPNSPEMSQTGRGLRVMPSKTGVSDFWQQRYDVGTVIA